MSGSGVPAAQIQNQSPRFEFIPSYQHQKTDRYKCSLDPVQPSAVEWSASHRQWAAALHWLRDWCTAFEIQLRSVQKGAFACYKLSISAKKTCQFDRVNAACMSCMTVNRLWLGKSSKSGQRALDREGRGVSVYWQHVNSLRQLYNFDECVLLISSFLFPSSSYHLFLFSLHIGSLACQG